MREVPMDGMLPLDEEALASRYCPASAATRKKKFLPVALQKGVFVYEKEV